MKKFFIWVVAVVFFSIMALPVSAEAGRRNGRNRNPPDLGRALVGTAAVIGTMVVFSVMAEAINQAVGGDSYYRHPSWNYRAYRAYGQHRQMQRRVHLPPPGYQWRYYSR